MEGGNSEDLLESGNMGKTLWAEKKIGTYQNAVIEKLAIYRLFREFFIFLHFLQSIIFAFSTKYYFAFSAKSTLLFSTTKCYFATSAKFYFAKLAKFTLLLAGQNVILHFLQNVTLQALQNFILQNQHKISATLNCRAADDANHLKGKI